MNTSNKLTFADLFIAIWKRLLTAREQEDKVVLDHLMAFSYILQDVASSTHDRIIYILGEELEDACRDTLMGVSCKSTISSEEEIRQVLSSHG